MSFQHQVRVRYSECDQQGVVFNAHYMSYMDDATDVWLRTLATQNDGQTIEWEWMVVRSTLEWQSSARTGELLDIQVGVLRFGNTSLDVGFMGAVDGRSVFRARNVYVTVDRETLTKMTTPDDQRTLLGELVDWDVPT